MPRHKTKGTRPDIVVIKLKEPFDLNDYVKPACLPTKPIKAGSKCFVSGWGHTKPLTNEEAATNTFIQVTPDRLQAAKLEIVSSTECEKIFYYGKHKHKHTNEPFLKDYEICVKGGNQDICFGDSGGPLVCEGIHIYILRLAIREDKPCPNSKSMGIQLAHNIRILKIRFFFCLLTLLR